MMKAAGQYLVAVAAVFIALLLTSALADLVAPMPMFFLWVAVLVTALLGGVGPAFFAILLCLIAVVNGGIEPLRNLTLGTLDDVLRLLLFAVFAGGISLGVGFRQRAEERAEALDERLRRSGARYRTLVEASARPQAVWTATSDGRIDWTDSFLRITGLTRDEIEHGGGIVALHPDDAKRFSDSWREAVRTERAYEDEVRIRVASGRYRWCSIRAVPVVESGRLREWVGIVADIDDEKRTTEHTEFINSASELLSSSLGYEQTMGNLARLCVPSIADWCSIDIGDAAGYERLVIESERPEELALVRELDRLRPEREADVVAQVMRTAVPNWVAEMTDAAIDSLPPETQSIIRQLGLRSWIVAPMVARGRTLGALSVVCSHSGRTYDVADLAFIQDLASRAATAIDNARLYEAASAANRAKDEFLATLSHELRTPLTAITGWAHMLQLGMDPETTKVAIGTIVRSAKSQAELIDDLLDLSRVVAGTLKISVAPMDLAAVTREVLFAARPAIDAKRIDLTVNAPTELSVSADERRLRQVIWNLVSNAVKFTEAGGRIDVSITDPGETVRFTVSDSGRGMEAAFLPHVWDRFRQADSSTSRLYGGLGLGLAVVRHLVELHGGTVGASSEGPGKGSTFWFELPVLPPHAIAADAAITEDTQRLQGLRIMLVEDEDDVRLVIATMLRLHGAEVTPVSTVADAATQLSSESFAAVISDLAMPDMDGVALVRQARGIPVIALSGVSGRDDRAQALKAGFSEFIRKPVDPDRLSRIVSSVVGRE